jgi:hypothetical protein
MDGRTVVAVAVSRHDEQQGDRLPRDAAKAQPPSLPTARVRAASSSTSAPCACVVLTRQCVRTLQVHWAAVDPSVGHALWRSG